MQLSPAFAKLTSGFDITTRNAIGMIFQYVRHVAKDYPAYAYVYLGIYVELSASLRKAGVIMTCLNNSMKDVLEHKARCSGLWNFGLTWSPLAPGYSFGSS